MKLGFCHHASFVAAVAVICFSVSAVAAQETTPAPTTTPTLTAKFDLPLNEANTRKLVLVRVPGQILDMGYDNQGHPKLAHVLDAKGYECVVYVNAKSGTIEKVLVPRLTRKQAIAIAAKKVPGTFTKLDSEYSAYHPEDATHVIYITPKKVGPRKILTISDKTGKITRIDTGGDLG